MSREEAGLARYALLSNLLDQAFRVPGTRWRFGLDAIIGLVPGAGDVAGAVVGLYGVWIARQLGAPPALLARMLGALALDALVGAVPLLGDLFDFAYKPHMRNLVLLEKWLVSPHAVRRRSRAMLVVIPLAMVALLVGVLWLTIAALRWLATVLAQGPS
ncbi:MAG TPA: DUF4112 domain-containing protein [Steroidobacteraceae bacterium]|nr:DUF4112 domain-containing protein [Steroidobacteraceae bacterium]